MGKGHPTGASLGVSVFSPWQGARGSGCLCVQKDESEKAGWGSQAEPTGPAAGLGRGEAASTAEQGGFLSQTDALGLLRPRGACRGPDPPNADTCPHCWPRGARCAPHRPLLHMRATTQATARVAGATQSDLPPRWHPCHPGTEKHDSVER